MSVRPAPAPALDVAELEVDVMTASGWKPVVRNVSFQVEPGETLGIVGESGSGKTVTALALMGLLPCPPARMRSRRVAVAGEALGDGSQKVSDIRGRLAAMVFQEPMTSLNPAFTVGDQIAEVLRRHVGLSRRAAWERAVTLLDRVGIVPPAKQARAYPHQLSGGMRQRVMIAMSLACDPAILIADEPTTALDVTVQAEILQLLREIQSDAGMALLFISHDLGVIAEMCDRVAVMYGGQFLELSTAERLYAEPQHPYTKALLESAPDVRKDAAEVVPIPGDPPTVGALPSGCSFNPRCHFAVEACRADGAPELLSVAPDTWSRCLRHVEINGPGGGA